MVRELPRRWYHLSLATRLLLASNFVLICAVAIGGLLAWRVTNEALRAETVSSGKRAVATFAELNKLEFLDDASGASNLELRLRALMQQEEGRLVEAHVFNRHGELIASSVPDARIALPSALDPARLEAPTVVHHGNETLIASPAVYDQTMLGYVVFRFNADAIDWATGKIMSRSVVVLSTAVLINLVVLFFLLRRLLRPVGLLATAARQFAGGNYHYRIRGRLGRDDVGDMARSFNNMCDELETHLRFSNAALVDRIRSGEATDDGQEHQLSILFADAVGYTRWSQAHSAEEIFSVLRRSYSYVGELVVRRFDGIIDKFMGDGIMAHFGLRLTCSHGAQERARQALRATIYAQLCLRILALAQRQQSREPLEFRFGIASGRCLVGAIGATDILLDFSVIGNVVNLASRLEGRAPPGGLVIDKFTLQDVGEGFVRAADCGLHTYKGYEEPIQVFAVSGFADPVETQAMQSYLLDSFFANDALAELLFFDDVSASTRAQVCSFLKREIQERPYLVVPASP